MSATPSDDDWVWVLRKDNVIRMYGGRYGAFGGRWPWYVDRRPDPAWNADLPEAILFAFDDWTPIRATRAEAEALLAMARAEAAVEGT